MAHLSSLNRWNPQAYLSREPFYRLFDTVFGNEVGSESLPAEAWNPPVDIQETDNAYRLQVELPGLTKDDINVTLENNVLRLSGERKVEKDVKKENYHRIERTYGRFSRSFALPQQVNPEGVEAKFENGVLTLTVPKAEQVRPRRIAIG